MQQPLRSRTNKIWLLISVAFATAAITIGLFWPAFAETSGGFTLQLPFREASIWQDWPGTHRSTVWLSVDGRLKPFGIFEDSFVAQPGDTWFVYGLHGYQAASQTVQGSTLEQWNGRHNGIDFVATPGLTVRAAADGEILFVGDVFGTTVIVQHERGFQTTYGYLKDVTVAVGDFVAAGDALASVGTAQTQNPHLHFALDRVRADGTVVATNPLRYLDLGTAIIPQSGANSFWRGPKKPAEQDNFIWRRDYFIDLSSVGSLE